MFFRHFRDNKQLSRAGFIICAPEELESHGITYEKLKKAEPDVNYFTWKIGNYLFDGSIWRGIVFPDWDERSFLCTDFQFRNFKNYGICICTENKKIAWEQSFTCLKST